jgi:signal transduction histidine kinase
VNERHLPEVVGPHPDALAEASAELHAAHVELQLRHRWADAVADIQLALLGDVELAECLDLLARSVAGVAGADGAAVVVVNDRSHLTTVAATGSLSDRAGTDVEMDSLSGAVARSRSAVRFADLAALRNVPDLPSSAMPAGPAIAVALPASSGPLGALWLHRVDPDRPFTPLELEVAEAFGRSAGLAIGIGMARHVRHEAEELAERDHLAARLHDRVIQRLFALGMSLEAMAGSCQDPTLVPRLRSGAEEVDTAIDELRDAIFGLTRSRPSRSARMRLAEAVLHAVPHLGFRPDLEVDGLVDSTLPPTLVDDAVDVVRTVVADLAERDGVRSAVVRVRVDDRLTISIDDDGPAPSPTASPSLHLAKVAARAHAVGGSSVVSARDGGGRRLRWQVPLRGWTTTAARDSS